MIPDEQDVELTLFVDIDIMRIVMQMKRTNRILLRDYKTIDAVEVRMRTHWTSSLTAELSSLIELAVEIIQWMSIGWMESSNWT